MRLLNNKWTALAGALAMTFALAACGGGSSPQATGPDPALTAAQTAAMAAAEAAKKASDDAAAAADAVEDNGAADPASYALARAAANDAMDAYEAAMAANEAAEAAASTADAEAAQADAEAAQADAEAALKDAMKYAGMVTDAHTQMVADMERERQEAAAELAALTNARTAADTAADAAETAASSARAAVQAVMSIAGSDQGSYDTALEKAEAAEAAAKAARDASDVAVRATTSDDAEAAQADAEMAQTNAEAALADAMSYAGMVTQAKADADEAARLAAVAEEARKMLADAKQAAQDAADAAMTASDAASAAVEEQRANKDLSTITAAAFARAEDAAVDAAKAAGDAAAANNAAQAATTQEDVDMYRQQAKAAQDAAELAQANAMSFAGMVASAKKSADDNANEANMLAEAKTAASEAAAKARTAADEAEAAAVQAEADAPGSTAAMNARTAADAAEAAAMLAEAENQKAQAATDSTTAIMAQMEAEAQQNQAEGRRTIAEANRDTARDSRLAAEQVQEERDIVVAQNAAKAAAMAAMGHYKSARMKASDARERATAARMAASKAMAARTDYANADKYAKMAEMAADEAESARDEAKMASDAAQIASMSAMAATTSDGAEMHQAEAEKQNGIATANHTGDDGAGMQYMAAKNAAMNAEMAADTHILSLFLAANGAHVMDDEGTMNIDEKAAHVTSVGAAMAAIAVATNGNQGAGTTVTASWLGDTVDNPLTVTDESVERSRPMITVTVAGSTGITVETRASKDAMDLNTDGDTTDPGEARIIQTAREIANLGRFKGYDLWEDDGDMATTTDRARAILFTDKKQGKDSVLAVVGGSARSVENQTVTATDLSNVSGTGNTITGVTWTPSGEPPLTGTLTCPDTACNIVLGEDGAVTTISGYTFTGSRGAVEAVTAADATEDNDYLAFGLWLEESDDGATDTFGAFAVGGTDYAVNVQNAVTGTASYSGVAAGAHHKTGEGVNWFDGNATLMANFGNATDQPGTISGEISQIRVNGGDPMPAPIYLGQANLSDGSATFNGAAFMGAATAPGAMTHEFDGTWSGSFFGATTNNPDTADVDESITAPLAAAGTFGVTKSEGTGGDMVVESFVGAFGAHKQ